jgi:hypothetical protein
MTVLGQKRKENIPPLPADAPECLPNWNSYYFNDKQKRQERRKEKPVDSGQWAVDSEQ